MAKNKILFFEYEKTDCEDCYYILELDTLHKYGRFCVMNCYDRFSFIDIAINYKYVSDSYFQFYTMTYYCFSKNDESLELVFDLINDNFFLEYSTTNRWTSINYAYHNDKNDSTGCFTEEKIKNSPLLVKYNITWFPPHMKRIKKIDWNRFPKNLRKELKKNSLK